MVMPTKTAFGDTWGLRDVLCSLTGVPSGTGSQLPNLLLDCSELGRKRGVTYAPRPHDTRKLGKCWCGGRKGLSHVHAGDRSWLWAELTRGDTGPGTLGDAGLRGRVPARPLSRVRRG